MSLSTTYTKVETDFLIQQLEEKASDKYNDESNSIANDIIKFIDINTGENVNYRETTSWYDGSAMNDGKVDGVIYIKKNSKYYRREFTEINAKWFKQDSDYDDTVSIQKWLDASKFGNLFLPSGIYYISNAVKFSSNTRISGEGVLKRANAISTQTTTPVTTSTNPTVISVVDASNFRVGMSVTVTTGFNNSNGCYRQHYITAVNGNNITVDTNFTKDMPSGSTLVTHHEILSTIGTVDNVVIEGITVDGNSQNNNLYTAWQVNFSAYISANNSEIKNCKFINNQADGLIAGGTFVKITGNLIENSGGNGLHLSGISNCNITNNRIINSTLSITGTDNTSGSDHADGAITWSELVSDIVVDGNYFDTGRTIIGGIGGSTNNDIQFINNVCKNATFKGIEFVQSSTTPEDGKNMIVANNKFFNCKRLSFENSNGGGLGESIGVKNVIINGNHLIGTTINLHRAKYINISDNIFDMAANTDIAILMDRPQYTSITNNWFKNGGRGVYISASALSGVILIGYQLIISENKFTNQKENAITFEGLTGYMYPYATFDSNDVYNDLTNAGFVAVQGSRGVIVRNNNINVVNNGNGVICSGDSVANPYGIQGTIVTGNNIVVPSANHSVRMYTGESKCVAKNNTLSKDVTNEEPTHNTVSDNYIFG